MPSPPSGVPAWDTTVVSRIQPGSAVLDHVLERATAGDPVRITAPSVLEVAYGYERRATRDGRFRALLGWFTSLLGSGALRVVPLDGRAALVAGRMRAAAPHPPGRRRGDARSKTMRQAAWVLDIQISATAFVAGLDVATENRHDFDQLSTLLARLFPEAPRLAVVSPPV